MADITKEEIFAQGTEKLLEKTLRHPKLQKPLLSVDSAQNSIPLSAVV